MLIDQEAPSHFPILTPITLQEQGGITTVARFTGIYNQRELCTYFQMLRQILCSSQYPIGFILNSSTHTITVGWSSRKSCWILIDPNNLPYKEINYDDEAAAEVMSSFSKN